MLKAAIKNIAALEAAVGERDPAVGQMTSRRSTLMVVLGHETVLISVIAVIIITDTSIIIVCPQLLRLV
jgi:hypothetical protein